MKRIVTTAIILAGSTMVAATQPAKHTLRSAKPPATERYGSLPNRRNRIIVQKIVGSSLE
jgi:hypothetical protein